MFIFFNVIYDEFFLLKVIKFLEDRFISILVKILLCLGLIFNFFNKVFVFMCGFFLIVFIIIVLLIIFI